MADGSENINTNEDLNDEGHKELTEDDRIEAENVKKEINQKVSAQCEQFESNIRDVFNERLASMENNMDDSLAQKVTSAKLDILKVNKTFREISRPIGSKWKELLKELLTDLPSDQVSLEINRVEKQSPILLQPYKALMTWKELRGPDFAMADLMEALVKVGLNDLEKRAAEIMSTSSADELIQFSGCSLVSAEVAERMKKSRIGNGVDKLATDKPSTNQPSTTTNQPSTTTNQPSTTTNQSSSTTNQPLITTNQPPTTTNIISSDSLNPEEALDDRHLLLLAKKMSDCWFKVAAEIGVAQQEVDYLVESEGKNNYQAAFRMLYGWREGNDDPHENLTSLVSALHTVGRPDLIRVLS